MKNEYLFCFLLLLPCFFQHVQKTADHETGQSAVHTVLEESISGMGQKEEDGWVSKQTRVFSNQGDRTISL